MGSSHFSPSKMGSQRSNAGSQAWEQLPSSAEQSQWPFCFFKQSCYIPLAIMELTIQPRLSRTCSNPPSSDSQVLGLQA